MKSKILDGKMDGKKVEVELYVKDDGSISVTLRDRPLSRTYDASAGEPAKKLIASVSRSCGIPIESICE